MKLTDMNTSRKSNPIAIFFLATLAPIFGMASWGRADDTVAPAADIQAGPRALSQAFRIASRKATPSVVTVFSYGQNVAAEEAEPDEDRPGPTPAPQSDAQGSMLQLTGLGSGVIISPDGLVITNFHVIDGAKKVVVQLSDETEIVATKVHGDRDSDVATLRIDRDEAFEAAELGDSDSLEIGDWVLAIGSPFKLEATVSAGIISAQNRTLQRIRRGRLLQTDAAINPGNSGGPLVDIDGRVIAINTAIATRNGSYQGIGFAIPINQVKWIADELDQHSKVRRAAMGIQLAELTPRVAAKLQLPVDLGVLVYQIIANSAAEQAGIQALDVILEFAGERVREPATLQEIVERKPIGSLQPVKVYRQGEELTLEVRLAPIEDPTNQLDANKDDSSKDDASEKEANKDDASDDVSDGAQESGLEP